LSGGLTLVAGMTYVPSADAASIVINGTGSITTAGKSIGNFEVNGAGITVTFQDSFTQRAATTTLTLTQTTTPPNLYPYCIFYLLNLLILHHIHGIFLPLLSMLLTLATTTMITMMTSSLHYFTSLYDTLRLRFFSTFLHFEFTFHPLTFFQFFILTIHLTDSLYKNI
jgi:hypothetical protein